MAVGVVRLWARKYGAIIFFPSFTAATIYADWSHTQAWKARTKSLKKE